MAGGRTSRHAASAPVLVALIFAGCASTVTPSTLTTAPPTLPSVAAATATPEISPSIAPSPTDAPAWFSEVVADGDKVRADGYLLEDAGGTVTLCPEVIGFAIGLGGVGCMARDLVSLSGLDARALPGEQRGGQWLTRHVRVHGTWSTPKIEVAKVELTDRPAGDTWTVPCPTPAGGWPGESPRTEVPYLPAVLEEALAARSDVDYFFIGQIEDSDEEAYVVGTVADVDTERERLEAIYPYNLCVVAVSYSWDDLERLRHALDASSQPWQTSVDLVGDRIQVQMRRLTTEMAEALVPYAHAVVVEPIVRPDT
jgi:hypothetical protein